MKAVVYTGYGSPNVLQLEEVEEPTPGDDQVVVKVAAVSINAVDYQMMRGRPALARFVLGGFRKPKNPILGADFAGRVEAVGQKVTRFQPGDEVFGSRGALAGGAFAEYVCVRERALHLKPAGVSFAATACLPIAGLTALQALRDTGQVKPGQRVLINGASGGIGTFAVQLAKMFGAEVTAVCSTRHLDVASAIGADHVIDYTKQDFTRNGRQYDLIIDIASSRSISDYKRALAPEGVCVLTGVSSGSLVRLLRNILMGELASRMGSKRFVRAMSKLYPKDMVVMGELLAEGKVVPVMDRCYPLAEAAEAMRYFGEGHPRGKVIITMEQDRGDDRGNDSKI
jgi:NADPH:quinone reductase-like Zn-dependent oxidoreductase